MKNSRSFGAAHVGDARVIAGIGFAGGGLKGAYLLTGMKGAGYEKSGFLVAYCGWADHLGARRRHGQKGAAGAATATAFAMGRRDHGGLDERLQFPRHHAIAAPALDPSR